MKRKETQKGGAQKVREKKARELQDFAAKSKRLECFFAKSDDAGNYNFYHNFETMEHILMQTNRRPKKDTNQNSFSVSPLHEGILCLNVLGQRFVLFRKLIIML